MSRPVRRPGPSHRGTGWAALVLTATGLVGAGALATSVHYRRQLQARDAHWRDRLHHRVMPSLHAAHRALDRGELDRASEQIAAATLATRQDLAGALDGPDPVVGAIDAATRTWASGLRVDTTGLRPTPAHASVEVRRAMAAIVRESLNNAARHQPDAITRVSLDADRDRITVSVAASSTGPPAAPNAAAPNATAPNALDGTVETARGGPGYGLTAMHRAAEEVGGHLQADLEGDSTLVVAHFPTGGRLRRRARSPRDGMTR